MPRSQGILYRENGYKVPILIEYIYIYISTRGLFALTNNPTMQREQMLMNALCNVK